MSPSELPWWGWIVTAFVLFLAALFFIWLSGKKTGGCAVATVLGVIFYITAFGAALIGVVRFIKWAWSG
jgi:hypothetical protein